MTCFMERFHVIKFVSNLLHGEVNSIRFHVIKFGSDLLHGKVNSIRFM